MKINRYKVDVDENGTKSWHNVNDEFHCEDGPAIERADGSKEWWLYGKKLTEDNWRRWWNGKKLAEDDWRKRKVVEIDGVKYKLVEA
jgi:hypothetical protein